MIGVPATAFIELFDENHRSLVKFVFVGDPLFQPLLITDPRRAADEYALNKIEVVGPFVSSLLALCPNVR